MKNPAGHQQGPVLPSTADLAPLASWLGIQNRRDLSTLKEEIIQRPRVRVPGRVHEKALFCDACPVEP